MNNDTFYKQNTLPDVIAKDPEASFPERIGPYKIEALLNQGGMSLLYLGLDVKTKQPLAIKVLSPQFVTSPEMMGQFMKEAAIIKLTNHPNIVKLYGQGKWEGGLYIAMELVRGISLRQFILQHSLSLKRSLDIILQVAYALCHLHTHGVIHGDLKPENILIQEDGGIKVVDFGIAQLHEEKESLSSTQRAGTPNYMSPEHKESPKKLTFVSDIYSLGVIAYELILGRLSFGIINLSLIPRGLRKIVGKCLAISIPDRYQDIVDLITDISQYLKSGEINKDKPGSDQLKEVLEELSKASQLLLPIVTPDWPICDMGVAKNLPPMGFGLYQDFWKLPNNALLTMLAIPKQGWIESGFSAAVLCGMCKSLVKELSSRKENFDLLKFVQKLNDLLLSQNPSRSFHACFLYLDPLQEVLSYIPCGFPELLHVPQGIKDIRKLGIVNPLLGSETSDNYTATNDNWGMGDKILMHSLYIEEKTFGSTISEIIEKAFQENLFYSAQRQAEVILKKASNASSQSKLPKVMVTFHRVS